MRPKIWTEADAKATPEKPMPFLRLVEMDGSYLIRAVSRDGIRTLANIEIMGGTMIVNARLSLDFAGYSTSWAEWDKEGRFVRLKAEDE